MTTIIAPNWRDAAGFAILNKLLAASGLKNLAEEQKALGTLMGSQQSHRASLLPR
ncbi:hypothetical protein [Trueperella bialowiezensis]|uniref:hypothetical protein n=1 Tax=Trueperella bialowiezensis TaxID=312285 RepID=UPI0013DEF6D0|nr:hypothetical protein [Trueperella bialowiezensis]